MPNLRNRTRVIYFRVSEEEFQKISDLSERRGARNISDFVRSVLQTTSSAETSEVDMHVSIERLEFVVERLTGVLSQMTEAQKAPKVFKESPNGSDPS